MKKKINMKKKCQKCEDRFKPDSYICEYECPYNKNGELIKVEFDF